MNTYGKNHGTASLLTSLLRFILGFFCCMVALAEAAALLAAATPGGAGNDRAALEAKKESLFQQMLLDPANLDAAFAYADVSAQLGDYEAAVSALERMLLFNPDLPRIQLELGALYFRMGSYELARDYFKKAAAAQLPPEIRTRLEQYLAEIDKRLSRHQLSGYLYLGGQYQSNANVAGSAQILTPVFPFPVLLNTPFTRQPSGSVFSSGSLLYSYDLETQSHDALEVSTVAYLSHYFDAAVTRLDLSLLEVTAGPRFNFPNGGLLGENSASFKPYLIVDEVGLGWNQYFAAVGPGIEYHETVWNDLLLDGVFELRRKYYANAPDRPLSTGLNGSDKLVSLSATKPVTGNSGVSLEFDYLDQSTQLAYYTNDTYALAGSYHIGYKDPLGITQSSWESSAYLGRAWSYYAAPDPCCNTSGNPLMPSLSTQLTQRWRFGVTQTWPVSDRIAIIAQLERDIVSSNLPLYAYTNTSFLVGPQIRF